jgi:hypothetical protein
MPSRNSLKEGKTMYCSTCGVAVTQGLSYCNYCGAKVSTANGDSNANSPEVKPGLLVAAMVVVFVLGMTAIIMLMGMMKAVLGLPVDRVLGFTVFPFLIMLLLEGVFMRLLLRRKPGGEEAGARVLSPEQTTRELDATQARALPEPVASVTEHTTRAFAPIPGERRSRG